MLSKLILCRFLFGLIAPFIGLFIGLQMSPWLANILMFPFIIVSALTDIPIGMMSGVLFGTLVLVSGVMWAAVLSVPGIIKARLGKASQAE